jgi:hypothetical protein
MADRDKGRTLWREEVIQEANRVRATSTEASSWPMPTGGDTSRIGSMKHVMRRRHMRDVGSECAAGGLVSTSRPRGEPFTRPNKSISMAWQTRISERSIPSFARR